MATSFTPYDPALAIGEVSASEALNPTSAAPRGRRNKCGALAGAAGSIVGQGLAVATGLQDRFSWKGVALAAIGGGVGGAGLLGSSSGVLAWIGRGVLGNVLTQGTSLALGLQQRFDFVGLAVAGVAGGVGDVVSDGKTGTWRQVKAGAASAIAGAATRSIATGTSFGDNVLAVLPDVIGTTIGRVVGAAVVRHVAAASRQQQNSSAPASIGSLEYTAPDIRLFKDGFQAFVNRERYRNALIAEAHAENMAASSATPGDASAGTTTFEGEFVVTGRRDPRPAVETYEQAYASSRNVAQAKAQYQEEYDRVPGRYNPYAHASAMANYDRWYEYYQGIEARIDARIDRELAGITLAGPLGAAGLLIGTAVAGTGLIGGLVSSGLSAVGAEGALRYGQTGQVSAGSVAEDFGYGVLGYGMFRVAGRIAQPLIGRIGVSNVPVAAERAVPTWKGSGPIPGTFGVNSETVSTKGLENFFLKRGHVEYIFDPETSTLIVGNGKWTHSPLAGSIDADTSRVVGGMFSRTPNGTMLTNEASGHFWRNWTPNVRQQFSQMMQKRGFDHIHHEGM
ncbi:polymorphic toxin type 43 domain-containing protein [Sphingomonas silueang]|uniref:polymorphic toxin type 43 domain-containing protein n=1 Tax=Sphingomonas silueang TaxID=3156617 RepID=UPI0032B488CD